MRLPLGIALTVGGWLLPTDPMSIYVLSLTMMAIGGFLVGQWATSFR